MNKQSFSSNKLLIVGSTGFLGRNLINYFSQNNEDLELFATYHSKKPEVKNCLFYKCDLLKKEEVKNLIKDLQPEFIINCAFIGVSSGINYSREYILDNQKIFLNLLEACEGSDCLKKIINIGSSLEYNDKNIPITEEDKIGPKNLYAGVKTSNSFLGNIIAKKLNLPLMTIRPFHLFGPYDDKSVLYYLISHCLLNKEIKTTPGDQVYDYLYIKNLCNLMDLLIKNYKTIPNYEFYNAGSGKGVRLAVLFDYIKKKLAYTKKVKKLPYSPNEYRHNVANISKIKKYLSWEPEFSLEEGLDETIDWVRKQRL